MGVFDVPTQTVTYAELVAATVASLRYEGKGGFFWEVRAIKAPDGYVMCFCNVKDGPLIKAGTFRTGKAFIKYARQQVPTQWSGFKPVVDTLDNLRAGTHESVVPVCYALVGGLLPEQAPQGECNVCVYREECGQYASIAAGSKTPAPKESEKAFLERLKLKVREQWGN